MNTTYDETAPKRPANLSVNSDLLRQARALGINLSATLEEALAERLHRRQRDEWLAQHRAQIEAYNRAVDERGVFSDGLRSF
jgi:antitoxin CcdA